MGEVDCWGFLTSSAAADRLTMAEGNIDNSRVGDHHEGLSFVVPAGSNEGTWRRGLAFGFCLTRDS